MTKDSLLTAGVLFTMLDSVTDGKRHPDEDTEYLTPAEEVKLGHLTEEYVDALERDDRKRADELRDAIDEMFRPKTDEYGFWV